MDPAVDIELSTLSTARIIKNLYPLYLHDLSAFTAAAPNAHGVLAGPAVTSFAEQVAFLDPWWQAPRSLFPFLIRVDELPAGFALVASGEYVEKGLDCAMQEFFVAHPYRVQRIAERAALQVFARFPGKWEIRILGTNLRAAAFWTRVVQRIDSDYDEEEGEVAAGHAGKIMRLVAPGPG